VTVLDIVRQYLDSNGFDGLYAWDCGCACKCDDLAPCGNIGHDCMPGYLQSCPDDCGDHDWHIGPKRVAT
jgi:hypothetical protein